MIGSEKERVRLGPVLMSKGLELKDSTIVEDVHANKNSILIVDREWNLVFWNLIAVFHKGTSHCAMGDEIVVHLIKPDGVRQEGVVSLPVSRQHLLYLKRGNMDDLFDITRHHAVKQRIQLLPSPGQRVKGAILRLN